MAVSMEYGHPEDNTVAIVAKKTPLHTTLMNFAGYVIQDPNGGHLGKVLKECLDQCQCVELLLTGSFHIHKPKDPIMPAKQCHDASVIKELHACFLCEPRLQPWCTP
jgi:hypothetical protein